ncbi:peptidoglycan-binding protein [Bradyrhizobium sp. 139]|uniref:peptidoglycan-binding protein n=1 Tax=Bradyrhizobium sp. 139 TaxID=2782616 RepID=UPI001FF8AE86|nr:peptidoglycan-binding protein [Bradyrhizobium sp. 139]
MREGGSGQGRGKQQIGKDQTQRGQKDQTVGQGRSDRDQARQSEQRHDRTGETTQGPNAKPGTTTGANTRPGTTTGASTREQTNAPAQGPSTQQGQGTAAGTNTPGTNTQGQANAPTQTQGAVTQSMSGRVSLNAQQQTTLQSSVLGSRNVARVDASSINFRINTGVVVPRNISVVSVSAFPVLIDVFPAFREDSFFVVDDEIVVLDRSRRVVDVVPAGPRTRFSHAGGGSVAALSLNPDEIRVVQQVLIERGLLTGQATGTFDTRTREALITFQQQQGFQATGTIDTRTVAALGVSNRISATQNQSTTTTGQGQAAQQPSAQQNTTGQNTGQATAPAPQNQPATTGQAQQNQPATTGQAGTQQPPGQTTGQAAPPAQSANPPSGNNMPAAQTNQNQTNQNNAPAPSTTDQPAQNQPNR